MHYTNWISLVFEKFASCSFPRILQRGINKIYINLFNLNMDEFDTLDNYANLNALFMRSLIHPRSFDKDENVMIAPCDSEIFSFGEVKNNLALQIKGKEYKVSDFLKEELEGYSYTNFYLSPRDYHRFHAPFDLKVLKISFIPGILLSVNEKSLLKNEEVFSKNKRVVLECQDNFGNPFYFIAVGALNVGRIQINFYPESTNFKESKEVVFDTPIILKKGDEIGSFLMGSTIVTFSKNWEFCLKEREKVYFGQLIAKYKG